LLLRAIRAERGRSKFELGVPFMKTILLGATALLSLTGAAFAAQAPQVPVETVIITASPFAQSNLDVAASVTEVPREELLTNGGFGIGDALKNVPGVASTGFSTGSNRPVIRGLSSTRVRVTENGIGGHDTSDVGDDHAVPIDTLSSLQVEVLRGPATLRYGSQAIGGVVNAINNRIPLDLAEGTAVEAFGSIADNSTERLAGALGDYRDGNWALHADGIVRGADEYDTPLGKQPNSFAFGHGYAFGGAYIGDGGGAAGANFQQYIAHYGAPVAPGDVDRSHVYLDTKSYNGAGRWTSPFPGIMQVTAQGGYTDYFHDEISDAEGLLAHFTNKEWEGRAEATHDPFGPITTGAFGMQYDHRDFGVSGPESDYLHPTRTRSIAGYIFEDVALTDRLSLQGAARVEWTGIKGDTDALGAFDRKFTPLSFAGGAVFKPREDTSLFVNLSRVTRAPNPVEMFAQGPHDTSGTFEFGDPGLGLEKAFSMEGGVKYQAIDGTRASFSAYRTRYSGFIDGVLTGNTRDADGTLHLDDTGEFRELLYLQNDATFWGLEAQAHVHIFDLGNMGRAGFNAQADYVRATLDGLGNVPRIPPLRYGAGLFYESNVVALEANLLRVDTQDKIESHETPTAGYTTLDASAIFHIFRGAQGDFDIALTGTNLTDSVQRNHISFVKDFWVQPGRTFRVLLHYTL
jgi:iron complex outermembrane receptor protein